MLKRQEPGKPIFYIDCCGVRKTVECGGRTCDELFRCGNYFLTQSQATRAKNVVFAVIQAMSR